jgi:hypothetical protein
MEQSYKEWGAHNSVTGLTHGEGVSQRRSLDQLVLQRTTSGSQMTPESKDTRKVQNNKVAWD